MLTEFRDSVADRARFGPGIGGIVGAALDAIVSSLIDGAILPVVGLLHGPLASRALIVVSGNPNTVPVSAAKLGGTGARTIGLFINAVVNSSVSPSVCFSSSRALAV